MDRGEFLKYTGLFVLGLIGFGAIFNAFNQINISTKELPVDSKSGFGGGKYGV